MASLPSEDAYEYHPMPPNMSECFFHFLQSKQGPHLSPPTIRLLSDLGISNGTDFLDFSHQDFSDILSSLSDRQFYFLTSKGLPHIMICGTYLWENALVQHDGDIRTWAFDPHHYRAFRRRHRTSFQKTFDVAYEQELAWRIHIAYGNRPCEDRPVEGRDTSQTSDNSFYDALTMAESTDHTHVSVLAVSDTGEATAQSDDSFFDALDTDASTDCSTDLFFDAEDWDYDSNNTNPPSDPDCPSPTPNASSCPVQQYPYSQTTLNLSRLRQPRLRHHRRPCQPPTSSRVPSPPNSTDPIPTPAPSHSINPVPSPMTPANLNLVPPPFPSHLDDDESTLGEINVEDKRTNKVNTTGTGNQKTHKMDPSSWVTFNSQAPKTNFMICLFICVFEFLILFHPAPIQERGGPKFQKRQPAYDKSAIPTYPPVVKYGTRKQLTKRSVSSDWIKHYMIILDELKLDCTLKGTTEAKQYPSLWQVTFLLAMSLWLILWESLTTTQQESISMDM